MTNDVDDSHSDLEEQIGSHAKISDLEDDLGGGYCESPAESTARRRVTSSGDIP